MDEAYLLLTNVDGTVYSLAGFGVAKVVRSEDPKYKEGDIVEGGIISTFTTNRLQMKDRLTVLNPSLAKLRCLPRWFSTYCA